LKGVEKSPVPPESSQAVSTIVYIPDVVGVPVSVGFEPSYVPGDVMVLPVVPNTRPGGIVPLIVHD
jgi:hypothetical protein